MDAALLSGTDTDSLSVLDVADGVRLGVLQRDEGDNQVALGLSGEGLVLCGDVLKQGRVVQLDLVASLFEGHAEALLALNGLGLVVGSILMTLYVPLRLSFRISMASGV